MNTFTAQELSDFYQQVADGGEIEHKYPNGWSYCMNGPDDRASPEAWRIKPANKVIDLSVLIDGIDCEFSDESKFPPTTTRIAKLKSVGKGPNYHASNSPNQYLYCQPRMNHKHAWDGGECPLPEGFKVKVWYNKDTSSVTKTSVDFVNWERVIYVMFLEVEDGYVMPWESD
jgi:hypothetical protein